MPAPSDRLVIALSLRTGSMADLVRAELRSITSAISEFDGNLTTALAGINQNHLAILETHDSGFLVLRATPGRPEVVAFAQDLAQLSRVVAGFQSESNVQLRPAPALTGQGEWLEPILRQIQLLSRVTSNVLVTGETGTGKDLVARLIHNSGDRQGFSWVAVNCAAIPTDLLESELFGHERGAFTGAHARQVGKIEQADGGTLFLDEIGDMSLGAQAKLLRVIETHEVQPVGSARARRIDFRLISATNQNLERLVQEKRFRADLFFRLSVARIHLPALSQRPGDIPALAEVFVAEMNARFGRSVEKIGTDSLRWMTEYPWPGNVRELRCAIESAFVYQTLDTRVLEVPPRHAWSGVEKSAPPAPICSEKNEREDLLAALSSANWNKTETARRMNWSRMTLYRKLRKYNMREDGDTGPFTARTANAS
jgi:DNA-binding NtrC family response regulator